MEKVTAVILNYNSSSDCEKCISFLKKQNYDDLGIIVVDNASNDDELSAIKKISDANSVDLICNEVNKGFAAGNNVGLRAAVKDGAEWCLVINPDVELRDENYVSNVQGIYPVGEGAGYSGGITSSAIDGIKVAEKIIERYSNN